MTAEELHASGAAQQGMRSYRERSSTLNRTKRISGQGLLAHPCPRLVGSDTSTSRVVLLADPHAIASAALWCAVCPAWLLSREKLVCLRKALAVLLNNMSSSPLSIPGTPRTASPLPTEEELTRPASLAPDDAHKMLPPKDATSVWTTAPATSEVSVPRSDDTVALKGKEKAAKGPLNLLDLPMDILKEIIHQVSLEPVRRQFPCHCHKASRLITRTSASTHE